MNNFFSEKFGSVEPNRITKERQGRANLIYAYSPKAGRVATFESDLEYVSWLLIEFNPNVIECCEQFPKVKFKIGSKINTYTFDAWVKYRDGSEECIEVKPVDNLIDYKGDKIPKNWLKFQEYFKRNNINKTCVTDGDFKDKEVLLENYQTILPYLSVDYSYSSRLKELLLDFINQTHKLKLGSVVDTFPEFSQTEVLTQLFKLFHRGKVMLSLNKSKLTLDTLVKGNTRYG